MDPYVVLVMRGKIEAALQAIADRLGGDLAVVKAFPGEQESIVWIEAPLGHEILRWFNEREELIWFNYAPGVN